MKNYVILTIIILTTFFNSCKTTNVVTDFATIKQTLEINTWVLLNNNTPVKGFNGNNVTLKFRQENGLNIIGFAGCNNYTGSVVELLPEIITVGTIASTKMACPELQSENSYLDLLKQANRYELKGNKLSLYKDKIILLTYKAQ